ncbi:pyridoxal phosphate-dependent aminotransferase [Pseudomonas sp. SK]|uniref:pyridoxal phosphate-dependent aminotransferase n=1 Tax=Pseudomonas sp. SK TaxID=2729423 RepID=UPI001C49914A|nr:pyridoxal phosphate-dependent aminotransferase [Pseudomonas sp. SK]
MTSPTLALRNDLVVAPSTSRMRGIANELKERGESVINFAAGELDFDTLDSLKQAAIEAIKGKCNTYTPALGEKKIRQQLAAHVSEQLGVAYAWNEVGMTAGAKQALYNAAMVLINPGDEVIIPIPYWVTFPTQIELAGGKPVLVDTRPEGYQLTAERVAAAITPQTRAILINTPNNPTGAVYDSEALRRIGELAIRHDLWIIFDECYSRLIRNGGEHHSIVTLMPELKERTVIVNSFSKSMALTGWRLGYVSAPEQVIKAMENLQGHTTSNPNVVAQVAVSRALDDSADFIATANAILDARLQVLHEALAGIEHLRVAPAMGAFYVFADIQWFIGRSYGDKQVRSTDELVELILAEAKVAVVSGAGFGDPSGIRISYAVSDADVATGMQRLREFFARFN